MDLADQQRSQAVAGLPEDNHPITPQVVTQLAASNLL